ncbi:MAG TPA: hypothetical protein VM285_12360 [Polyangia bacterium]|nr:hypothetical protein [Polyangia bacterium]
MIDFARTSPLRWRLFLGWMTASAIVGIAACFLPLFETPGYELSLIAALFGSLGAGHLAACLAGRVRNQLAPFPGARQPGLRLFGRAAAHGLALLAPIAAASALNTLRVPPCNSGEGLGFFLLLPVPAVLLAAAIGLFAGLATPGTRSATAAWLLFWCAGLGAALLEFHGSPAVYSFGPFHGWFPGVLYDELIAIPDRLITYRAASLVQVALVLALIELLIDPGPVRLSPARAFDRISHFATALALVAIVLALYAAGPALGHRTRRADLEALLPIRTAAPGLSLRFPAGTHTRTASALTADAAFSLSRVEEFLGAPPGKPIAVFLFADADQKAETIGAAHTNVAKPWRSEVYVVLDAVPHSVLRHELAHAVAARFAGGPFAVPGALGGLVPDPGLVEGLATAAQGPRGDLTVHQWAAAMKREGLLPETRRLFGLRFFGLSAATAYIAAGSFCRFLVERRGAKALRAVYSGSTWEEATGADLFDLTAEWQVFLDGVALDETNLAAARHRFDRPSVIGSTCVHEVARLRERAAGEEAEGRFPATLATLAEAHRRSGGATQTRFDLFFALARAGDRDAVRAEAAKLLADDGIGAVRRDAVREILADLDVSGDPAAARAEYVALARAAPGDDARRTLEVKARLTGLPADLASPLLAVLARQPGTSAPPEPLFLLDVARAARATPGDPVLAYLLARQHCRFEDHGVCLALLESLPERDGEELPPSIGLEARMLRGRALIALGRTVEAASLFDALAADDGLRLGARELAAAWAARARFGAKTK